MKVVLYGATGKTGRCILTELLARGHTVTAVSRGPATFPPGVQSAQDDLSDAGRIARTIDGAHAVVSAYAPPTDDTDALIGVVERLIQGVQQVGAMRLIVVGGTGSLEVAPGVTLLDSGYLPEAWRPIAISHGKALDLLKASNINWTSLSPAAYFEPGKRTAKFRLGKDQLIANQKNESRISMEDYAIALVDELEILPTSGNDLPSDTDPIPDPAKAVHSQSKEPPFVFNHQSDPPLKSASASRYTDISDPRSHPQAASAPRSVRP